MSFVCGTQCANRIAKVNSFFGKFFLVSPSLSGVHNSHDVMFYGLSLDSNRKQFMSSNVITSRHLTKSDNSRKMWKPFGCCFLFYLRLILNKFDKSSAKTTTIVLTNCKINRRKTKNLFLRRSSLFVSAISCNPWGFIELIEAFDCMHLYLRKKQMKK